MNDSKLALGMVLIHIAVVAMIFKWIFEDSDAAFLMLSGSQLTLAVLGLILVCWNLPAHIKSRLKKS